MISGSVVSIGRIGDREVLEPRIRVGVAASDGERPRTVECVVDTGFTGWLALPPDIIRQFGLRYVGRRPVNLASGPRRRVRLYRAFIDWQEIVLPRLIHQSTGNPLVGMGLLAGNRLVIETIPGGNVSVTKFEPERDE